MSAHEVVCSAAGVADQPTDAELLTGPGQGFGLLFDRYATRLYRYCALRVGAGLAGDVVAETFLVAYERRSRYDASRPVALPWLYGIATNVLRKHRRAEDRAHRGYALVGAPDGGQEVLADRAAERLDASATVRALAADLAVMPQRYRDVLLLSAAGLTYEEIAVAVAVPIGTVRSRLNRARSRLRGTAAALTSTPDPVGDDHAQ